MEIWLMTAATNLAVGALVGLCGVAGFLLPIFYTAVLGMNVSEGLALSFAAFIVAGALGAWNYQKAGNLDVKFGLKLSCGSLIGAILGVYFGSRNAARINQVVLKRGIAIFSILIAVWKLIEIF